MQSMVAIFDGVEIENAQHFSLEGNLLAPEAAAVAPQAPTDKVEEATDLFGNLFGDDTNEVETPTTLTAQWLEFTLIAPDGHETHYRRTVLDRIGAAQRAVGTTAVPEAAPGEVARALFSSHLFMVAPGSYSPAYVLDRHLERMIQAKDALAAVIYAAHHPSETVRFPAQVEDLAPLDHLLLYTMFDAGVPEGDGVVSYRAEPSITLLSQGLATDPSYSAWRRVDIMHNARHVFRIDENMIRSAADEAVFAGAWETRAETFAIADPSGTVRSASSALAAATTAGIPLVVLQAQDSERVTALSLEDEAKVHLLRDLAAGYTVLIPKHNPDGSTHTGWWRIDPLTGETLGIGSDGTGQAFVEYLKQMEVVEHTVNALFAWISLLTCGAMNQGNSAALACCYVDTAAWTAVGFAVGFGGFRLTKAMENARKTAERIEQITQLFTTLGVTMNIATSLPITPGPCSLAIGNRYMRENCLAGAPQQGSPPVLSYVLWAKGRI